MEDSEIIALYHARSESAIAKTAEKYGRYCHAIAFRILQNDEDAEECVNDTYLRAWNTIPSKSPRHLKTFLGKITRNLSLNTYEKRTADKRGGDQIPVALDELAECLPADTRDNDPTDDLLIKEVLDRFVRGLSPTARQIFVRRYWHFESVAEIAAILGMSENYVSVTLMRTRKKLKTVLQKEGITV